MGGVPEGFPGPVRAPREEFTGQAGEAFRDPVRAPGETYPGPTGEVHGAFPGPVGGVPEGFPGPVRAPREEFTGQAGEAFRDRVRAPGETYPGPAGEGHGASPGPVGGVPEDIPGPVRASRETFTGPAGEGHGASPGPLGGAPEGFPGPVRAQFTGSAGEAFRDPVRAPRETYPGPAGEGREVFPDPVALAGAVGESFSAPGGPAAVPPPPPRPEGVTPAAGARPEGVARAAGAARTPARADVTVPPAPAPRGSRPDGPRTAARRSAQKAARRTARRRNLTAGVLTVSGLVVLPLVLWSTVNSGDGARAGADRPTGEAPDTDAGEASRDPSWTGAGDARKGALRGRLHNVSSDLCVGIDGEKAVAGGEAELTTCSADAAQQWTYETDGLLRNGAAPDLCLDSQLGYSVRLAPCAGASRPDPKNIRYDFTLQGTLVPRSDQDLALAPAATDGSGALVLKARTDDEVQRWVIDTSKADLKMKAVNWNAAVPAPRPTPPPPPTPSKTPEPTPTPSATSPAPQPTPSGPAATDSPCDRYGYYCDSDGQYGNPGYGYPGYGYGYGGRR
ncbi:RICIN domain-containing protein [Streptomyces tuirus]